MAARIPAGLLSAIQSGECVAFVGAGFSGAAGLPGWSTLLRRIAQRVPLDDATRAYILGRVGSEQLLSALRLELQLGTLPLSMNRRLKWLAGIPFRAVLTTNFDGILSGNFADLETYANVLRAPAAPRWDRRFWPQEPAIGPGALKLHGDLAQPTSAVVLTRRGYRRRLYHESGYGTFLKALMATRTLLYMGFSFEDAYLNELRSETLALLGHRPESDPLAYAIVNDVSSETIEHFRRHEGIQLMSYSSQTVGGAPDHSGFDVILEALYEATNPVVSFGRQLERRRILWIDPSPKDAKDLEAFLQLASQEAGTLLSPVVYVGSASEAKGVIEETSTPFSLIISHWGEGLATDRHGSPTSTAEAVLRYVRARDVATPVLIFAAVSPDVRKPVALSLGALDYCVRYESLLDRIDEVFTPGRLTA